MYVVRRTYREDTSKPNPRCGRNEGSPIRHVLTCAAVGLALPLVGIGRVVHAAGMYVRVRRASRLFEE